MRSTYESCCFLSSKYSSSLSPYKPRKLIFFLENRWKSFPFHIRKGKAISPFCLGSTKLLFDLKGCFRECFFWGGVCAYCDGLPGYPFYLLSDEQMSNKAGVEHQLVFAYIGVILPMMVLWTILKAHHVFSEVFSR